MLIWYNIRERVQYKSLLIKQNWNMMDRDGLQRLWQIPQESFWSSVLSPTIEVARKQKNFN